jgi:hypothetical protein
LAIVISHYMCHDHANHDMTQKVNSHCLVLKFFKNFINEFISVAFTASSLLLLYKGCRMENHVVPLQILPWCKSIGLVSMSRSALT